MSDGGSKRSAPSLDRSSARETADSDRTPTPWRHRRSASARGHPLTTIALRNETTDSCGHGLLEPEKVAKRACKPDPVPRGSRGGGHLSSPPVAGRIVRPTRGRGRAPLPLEADVPLFGLAPGGVCQHPVSPPGLVRSYRTLSPLPAPDRDRGRRRSALCGTFRRLATPGRYPAPRPRESGLSSPIRSGRPPGPLGRLYHTAPQGGAAPSGRRRPASHRRHETAAERLC